MDRENRIKDKMSIVDPLACSFAKVVLYEVFSDDYKLKR